MTDLGQLKDRLMDRIEALVDDPALALPPRTKKMCRGNELRFGDKGWLVVYIDGPKRGKFLSFKGPPQGHGTVCDSGDLIALVAWARDCSMGDAIKWCASWCGMSGTEHDRVTTAERRRRDAERKKADQARRKKAAGVKEEERKKAYGIWQRRVPDDGTLAAYLTGRGIDPATLPKTIGYVPDLEYWWDAAPDVTCDPPRKSKPDWKMKRHPAMVAAVQDEAGRFMGCHQTFLEILDGGGVVKAGYPDAKKIKGGYWGGSVQLSAFDPARHTVLAVAEGLETSMSVLAALAAAARDAPVRAAINGGNMGAMAIPGGVDEIILCGDGDEAYLAARIMNGDEPRSDGGKVLAKAVEVRRRQGYRVRIAVPNIGADGEKMDWNDVFQAIARPDGKRRGEAQPRQGQNKRDE